MVQLKENTIEVRIGCPTHISDYKQHLFGTIEATWQEHYQLQRLVITRPETGIDIQNIKCNTCGKEMTMEIASKTANFYVRLGALIFCLVISAALAFFLVGNPPTSMALGVRVFICFIPLFIGLVGVFFGGKNKESYIHLHDYSHKLFWSL